MKIIHAIREKGIRTSVAIVFDRIVPPWLLRMRRFNVYQMEAHPPASANRHAVVVRWCSTEEETRAVEELVGPQRSVVDVGAESMRACQATVDGELAGALWASTNVFMESGLTIRYELADHQAWLFAAYVEKRFRRCGVYSRILEFVLTDLSDSGKSQLLLSVNPDNTASKKVHEKYASRKLGTAFALRFLSFACCTVRGQITAKRWFTWNHKRNPIVLRFRA